MKTMEESKREVTIEEELLSLFETIMEEAFKIVKNKMNDYGAEALFSFKDFGCLVRANDKVMRLRNLYTNKSQKVLDETIEDTWIDLANYAILALVLIRKFKK